MVKVLLMQIYITFHEPGVQLFLGGQSIQRSMKNGKIGYNQFLPLNGIAPDTNSNNSSIGGLI